MPNLLFWRRKKRPSTLDWSPNPTPSEGDRYLLPRNHTEGQRLDYQHFVLKQLCGGRISSAPLQFSPRLILDSGCGTGRWGRTATPAPTWALATRPPRTEWPRAP